MNKNLFFNLFLLSIVTLFIFGTFIQPDSAQAEEQVPIIDLGEMSEAEIAAFLDEMYIGVNAAERPPIVMVHGWQGLPPDDENQPCNRPHISYVDTVIWAHLDEYLGQGKFTVTEATGAEQHFGLGFHVELARLDTGSSTTESDCTPVVEENVPYLIEAIDAAKSATGHSKVILIAHSMGGLVSRAYLESAQYRGDVVSLFTLGTPHIGVPVTFIAGYLTPFLGLSGYTLESYCDAQKFICQVADDESHADFPSGLTGIETFNAVHNQRATGVYYHLIGGHAGSSDRSVEGIALDSLITGEDDGIVPLNSALGLSSADGRLPPLSGSIDRRSVKPTLHVPTLATNAACLAGGTQREYTFYAQDEWWCSISTNPARHIPSLTYMDCLAPILDGRTDHGCGAVEQYATVASENIQPIPALIPNQVGTLQANGQAIHEIWLEQGEAVLAVNTDQETTPQIRLIAPNGEQIDPAYAEANPDQIQYKTDTDIALYQLSEATPGRWQLIVEAPASSGFDYVVHGSYISQVNVRWGADRDIFIAGETVTIYAILEGAAPNATVSATLTANNTPQTINLTADGNDRYSGQFTIPAKDGYAELAFLANGQNLAGETFLQQKITILPLTTQSVSLSGEYAEAVEASIATHATYDDLVMSVGIQPTQPGSLGLSADLVDEQGQIVAHASTIESVTPETQSINLRFRGEDIIAADSSGPFTLTNIRLIDYGNGGIVIEESTSAYETERYSTAELEAGSEPKLSIQNDDITSQFSNATHSCDIDNFGPYISGDTIQVSCTVTVTNGTLYPEWLDYYFIDAPDNWKIKSQSAPPTDQSLWNRLTGTRGCNDTGVAYWGLSSNPSLTPLLNPCELRLTNLPTTGSFYGPWAEIELYNTFSESFEGSSLPTGWLMQKYNAADYNGFVLSNSQAHSGSQSIFHDGYSCITCLFDRYAWLVMPAQEIRAGDQLVFWHYIATGSYPELGVYISTGLSDPSAGDFNFLKDISSGTKNIWQKVSIDLTDYASRDDVYIAFYYEGNNKAPWYLDDVSLERKRLKDKTYTFQATYEMDAQSVSSCAALERMAYTPAMTETGNSVMGVAVGDLLEPGVSATTYACTSPNVYLPLIIKTDITVRQ